MVDVNSGSEMDVIAAEPYCLSLTTAVEGNGTPLSPRNWVSVAGLKKGQNSTGMGVYRGPKVRRMSRLKAHFGLQL